MDDDLTAFLEPRISAFKIPARFISSTSRCRSSAPARSTASPSRRSTAIETRRSPSVKHGRIGVLLSTSGRLTRPRRRRFAATSQSSSAIRASSRSAHRVASDPARNHPRSHPAEEVGTRLQAGLDGGRLSLAAITRRQGAALQERLGEEVIVDFAMRYGNPASAIDREPHRAGVRTHPRRASLSAILRGDDGDRDGRGLAALRRCGGSRRFGRSRLTTTTKSTSTHC